MSENSTLQFAGQINLNQLKLVSSSGKVVDLNDYMVEMNLFEDMFHNFLYGNMQITDSLNLISVLPIIGEEYLIVNVSTPSLESPIEKTFRVYAITDKRTVKDNNTQLYILHFCSQEAIADILTPLYKPYEGNIADVIGKIFTQFLEIPRTMEFENNERMRDSSDSTPLYILNETDNRVKFISPGWTPAKCINWLASKSIPKEGRACDYLFWESNKAFYFGNIEKIFIDAEKNNRISGNYFYYPPNSKQTKDIVDKLFIAEDFEVVKTVDNLRNYDSGYLSNRIITLDLLTKKYDVTDFDYVADFNQFKHSSGQNSIPLFASNALRNPATHIKFYPVNTKLFSGVRNNISENMFKIYGNRMSRLSELNNFVINITVPGRTDLEAGCLIRFVYPDTSPKDETTEAGEDSHYSGVYLVSAIRHKITVQRHMMVMELVKDSLEDRSK